MMSELYHMRYWIFWNGLVQGPFEIDELVCLRAFNSRLMICPELSREWKLAGERMELTPYLREKRNSPEPQETPPSPPFDPSLARIPLQGEFFHDAGGQQVLFENDPRRHFYYRSIADPVSEESGRLPPPVTAPIRFDVIRPSDASESNPPRFRNHAWISTGVVVAVLATGFCFYLLR